MDLNGGQHVTLELTGDVTPIAVSYDPVEDDIFWSERNTVDTAPKRVIYRHSLAKGNTVIKEISRGIVKVYYIPV